VEYQSLCSCEPQKEIAGRLSREAIVKIASQNGSRLNAIWLETSGCSGNIISLLNSDNPNGYTVLTTILNLTYSNSVMGDEGEAAYELFLETLNTDFILLVDGAISTKDNGAYCIIAYYKGERITAYDAVRLAGERAKYVISVGTCASYGGISAARPNPGACVSVQEALDRTVIRLPTCPCHPDYIVGTVAHLSAFGMPELDSEGRPVLFYGITIHDSCTRRGFFDLGEFARTFGEQTCMFQLGCRGPVTRADCPRRKWNGYVNWPIGNSSNCIGCAQAFFPDGMEPFVRY
jgi:hydrogenase small subunit